MPGLRSFWLVTRTERQSRAHLPPAALVGVCAIQTRAASNPADDAIHMTTAGTSENLACM